MPARLSPCPHCGAPCDDAQRYCLACGEPCNDESARLLALAGGGAGAGADASGATSGGSSSPTGVEPPLVPQGADEDPTPLRNDRRALTSFGLAVAGVLLLLVGGWGTDAAQTLASALPPGLSVNYPSPGIAAGVATAAAVTGDDTTPDDATTDDTAVDEVAPVDDTVIDDTTVDDTVVDDTTTDDTTTDDTTTGDTPPAGDTADDEPAPPPIKHVYVIVLPDQDVAAAAQTPDAAPYLAKTLAPQGTILSGYRGIAAAGLPNTVGLISGQGPTPEIVAGCAAYTDIAPGTIGDDSQELGAGCAFSVQTGTIGDQLASNGSTWRAYTPDPAGTGCVDAATGTRQAAPAPVPGIAVQPDPFASFHTATDSADCPKLLANLDGLDADLAAGDQAPAFSYIQAPATATPVPAGAAGAGDPAAPVDPAAPSDPTAGDPAAPAEPTVPADPVARAEPTAPPSATTPAPGAADVALAAIDTWLSTVVPKILKSKTFQDDGLLVVTSDRTEVNGADDPACCRPKTYPNLKDTGGEGGRVGALLVSPYVAKGKVVDTSFSHFTLLRSIEDVFGLEPLGYAGLKTVGSLVPDVIESKKP